ncbi:MAG: NAD(P)-dependent alcohol dehydrogenase, partial [Haloferacaceae archaeon]
MQAARLHEYTDEMSDALDIDEIDRPEVSRSDGVVVRVEGAGWCQTDNHIIEGMWTDYVDQDLP